MNTPAGEKRKRKKGMLTFSCNTEIKDALPIFDFYNYYLSHM